MSLSRLSALALAVAAVASAEANGDSATTSGSAATATLVAVPLWKDAPGESSLASQAKAAAAAHRLRVAAARGVSVETIDATMADSRPPAGDNGNCRHLPMPGSRFMRDRCFYESPGEAALNEYQYRREFEESFEKMQREFLDVAEYSLAYRRYLNEQP